MSDPQASVSKPGEPGASALEVTDETVDLVARAIYDNFAFEPTDKSFAALADVWRKPAKAALSALQAHAVGGSPKPPNTIQGVTDEEEMRETAVAVRKAVRAQNWKLGGALQMDIDEADDMIFEAIRDWVVRALSPTSGEGNMDSRADALGPEEELQLAGKGGMK